MTARRFTAPPKSTVGPGPPDTSEDQLPSGIITRYIDEQAPYVESSECGGADARRRGVS